MVQSTLPAFQACHEETRRLHGSTANLPLTRTPRERASKQTTTLGSGRVGNWPFKRANAQLPTCLPPTAQRSKAPAIARSEAFVARFARI